MKKVIKHMTIVMVIFSLLLSIGMHVGTVGKVAEAADSKQRTILVGESIKVKLKTKKKVTWKSSNAKIAKVSSKGVIKGISKGKATVTATVKGVKKPLKINVKVEKPILSNLKLDMIEGSTVVLKVKGVTKDVKWRSSNTSVATVDNGKITAISEGNVNIIAKVSKQELICAVKVIPALGTRNNPLSAYDDFTSEVYDGEELIGKFNLKLAKFEQGDNVIKLMDDSRKEYTRPQSDQTYVYMEFNLQYLDGKEGIYVNDVLNFKENFYNSTKTRLLDNIAYVKEVNYTKDAADARVYPSGICSFTKTILVNKNDLPMNYRIQTGYDSDKNIPIYTWFKIQ